MHIFGPGAAADPASFERDRQMSLVNENNIYGVGARAESSLTADVQARLAAVADAVVELIEGPPKAPLTDTPIGSDYTIAELMAAVQADPALAAQLALTEVTRAQGPRKGALTFLASADMPDDAKALVAGALEVLSTPTPD